MGKCYGTLGGHLRTKGEDFRILGKDKRTMGEDFRTMGMFCQTSGMVCRTLGMDFRTTRGNTIKKSEPSLKVTRNISKKLSIDAWIVFGF